MPCPESFITVEINHYHHEVYAGKTLIVYITYDNSEFFTQPWELWCAVKRSSVTPPTMQFQKSL
ncbi:hypothetical protein H6G36_14705 [Anabaena minutissima FACHB-250]|nr:hypothetical protein [Anabaena minutissima FACHB-250]